MSPTPDPSPRIPLSALRIDQQGRISELGGDDLVRHRIEEMGLRPGAVVRMLRPRSPHIVALNGRRISLRTNAQLEIWVEPIAANGSEVESR